MANEFNAWLNSVAEAAAPLTASVVIAALKQGPLNWAATKRLAAELGVTQETAKTILNTLLDSIDVSKLTSPNALTDLVKALNGEGGDLQEAIAAVTTPEGYQELNKVAVNAVLTDRLGFKPETAEAITSRLNGWFGLDYSTMAAVGQFAADASDRIFEKQYRYQAGREMMPQIASRLVGDVEYEALGDIRERQLQAGIANLRKIAPKLSADGARRIMNVLRSSGVEAAVKQAADRTGIPAIECRKRLTEAAAFKDYRPEEGRLNAIDSGPRPAALRQIRAGRKRNRVYRGKGPSHGMRKPEAHTSRSRIWNKMSIFISNGIKI